MLTDMEIRQAIEFESAEHPVLSIYLNVDPHRRSPEKYKLALRNLLNKAEGASQEDIQRIQNYVEMGYNWQGRGIIMFSCAAQDFWRAKSFLLPVEDSVLVSRRPYVRQLAMLIDTYERYGVIHVEQIGARLYVFNMGQLEAVQGYLGEEVKLHKAGGWSASNFQRHEAELARHNLQDAAEMAEDFYRKNNTRRLILAGTEKNVARFRDLLSHRLRSMVVGQIAVDSNAKPAEVSEKALTVALQAAKTEAQSVADSVVTTVHKEGNAVAGLAETLTAVQNGRALHVVTLANFVQPAYRFVDSGYILLDLSEESDLQSGKVQKLPDAVDSVLRRAMVQGIGVTVLEQHEGLEKIGKIGALTRY
ncbi:MAG: Vms1/Ankzf1 family peptidyl-tRNA hydrolase [Caldilineaceae bacterium]